MGNRAFLSAQSVFEIEANNCIPITWFACFSPGSLVVEERRDGSEVYEIAEFRAKSEESAPRIESAITLLRAKSPAWRYLRPLEILHAEISRCPAGTEIVLDATPFWSYSDAMQEQLLHAPQRFGQFLQEVTGREELDTSILDGFISDFSIVPFSSVAHRLVEDLADVMFGTYWGERQTLYSEAYFDGEYWSASPYPPSEVDSIEDALDQDRTDSDLEGCQATLEWYLRLPPQGWNSLSAAVCYTVLGDFRNAQRFYSRALKLFLDTTHNYFLITQLLHSYLMSRRPHRHRAVVRRVSAMIDNQEAIFAWDHYALAVLKLFRQKGQDTAGHVSALLDRPADSEDRAIGLALASIVDRDHRALREALILLLHAFQKARLSVIGPLYLCLPSMTLARLAHARGMEVDIHCRYYSGDYVEFLVGKRRAFQ
jgi:tetratricopeptide (TPR) repeat protein